MKSKNKRTGVIIFIVLLLIFTTVVGGIYGAYVLIVEPAIGYTREYNYAVKKYNSHVDKYNMVATLAYLENVGGAPDKAIKTDTVSENRCDVIKSLLSGNSSEQIEADTQFIYKLTRNIEADTKTIEQIVAPEDNWVEDRIQRSAYITYSRCVTENDDPNQMLGKEGGYKGCVYFLTSLIDSSEVPGEGVIGKGTDGGGCIEIYRDVTDAMARCKYLASFDNTILYTGSYVLVGTMIIRTSYLLSDDQQLQLTQEITSKLLQLQ